MSASREASAESAGEVSKLLDRAWQVVWGMLQLELGPPS